MQSKDSRKRLFVVVESCSIYDSIVAFKYCDLLLKEKKKHRNDLLIVMRVYLKKSRINVD